MCGTVTEAARTGLGLAIVAPSPSRTEGALSWCATADPARTCLRLPAASDLDDDRQDHRPAAQPVVDQLGQVVVQGLLEQVDFA